MLCIEGFLFFAMQYPFSRLWISLTWVMNIVFLLIGRHIARIVSIKANTWNIPTYVVGNGRNMIAYCFADVKGYSKFGKYIGNGNADGTFIYTGFKPAFVMVKRTDATNFWLIRDNKRNTFNVSDKTIAADSASSETGWGTSYLIDYLSNGFKCRDNTTPINASGGTYIYMAFAEAPLVGTNGVTAKAR